MNSTEGQDFDFLPSINTATMKSRKIAFAGYVACSGGEKCVQDFVMET
jgi:hypothetical protein